MVLVCQIMDDSLNLLNILVYNIYVRTYVLKLKSATAQYVELTYVPIQVYIQTIYSLLNGVVHCTGTYFGTI